MFVPVGDIRLHVHDQGPPDARALILLHGGPGLDGSVFYPAFSRLAGAGWQLLAVDHRANGLSDAGDPARWTVPQMADDVQALIRELRLARPVVLGWSFGSFVAQAHMARHGSAAGYVLMGTVASPAALEGVWDRLAVFEPEHLRDQVRDSWAREPTVATVEDCRQLMVDQLPFHLHDPEGPLVDELRAADRIVYQPAVLRHFSADGDYGLVDLRPALARCGVPTLILSGASDRTTPAASAHELASVLPICEEVVIEGAAHFVAHEQPGAAFAALGDFLGRV